MSAGKVLFSIVTISKVMLDRVVAGRMMFSKAFFGMCCWVKYRSALFARAKSPSERVSESFGKAFL